ncbi:MAG: histidine phosphatase family protein [Clostridia bacterium]|nr:histidine phosphatase family protein [Clostridia bacterium]
MSGTTLYVVRHGRSLGNDQRFFQGRRDLPLCEAGLRQAAAASEHLRGIAFDIACTSPLSRARRTAEIILAGRSVPLLEDERLTEMDVGLWGGHPFSWIVQNDPEGARRWNETPDEHVFPGGESMAQAYDRINRAADEIAERNPGKTVLMVTHGGVLRCLWARITTGCLRAVRSGAVFANCSVSVFTFENGSWKADAVNDVSFMPEELLADRLQYHL